MMLGEGGKLWSRPDRPGQITGRVVDSGRSMVSAAPKIVMCSGSLIVTV